MKKLLYIWLLITGTFMLSCTQRGASDRFDRVEKYMEIYPDSALLLLKQLPHPEKLRGKQCADYALLLTQARDKNYLDSLQSDSLIKLAVDYYRDSDDKVKAGKALFYYGKVQALQDNDTVAMQAYLDAHAVLENTKEYKLQGLIQTYIGHLNDDRNMNDMALDNYRKSICYYRKAGDTLGIVYGYRNIARIYDIKQNSDSVSWYAETGISLLKGDSLSPVFPSLLQILGIMEKNKGHYSNAIEHFLTAIKYERIPNTINHYYLSLGNVYMLNAQLEKAKKCFEIALASNNIFTQSGAYNSLYLLEKKRLDYAQALFYKEQSDSLLKIERDESLRHQILTMQRKYENEKLLMENRLLEQETQNQLYFWLILFLLFIVLSIVFYLRVKKQYRRIFKKRLKAYSEKDFVTIQKNEQTIGQYICQLEELMQKEVSIASAVKEQIGKLNQKIQLLINENNEIRESSCAGGIYVLEQLKYGKLIMSNVTEKERNQVFEFINFFCGNIVTRLQKEYTLNKKNLMLTVLIGINFSPEELMIVYDCEKNSVYRKIQRLTGMLSLKSTDELKELFLFYLLKPSTK